MLGLMLNIQHIRARQIVDTATAISAGMNPDGIPADILNRAAETKADSLRMQAQAWKQAGRNSLKGQFGG